MAEWLARSTHDPLIAGSRLTAATQLYPLARYEPGQCPTMLSVKRLAMCSTRGGFQGMYITFTSINANKAEPTLALNPRGDITRNPKQGTNGPKIGHVNVSDKKKFKKEEGILGMRLTFKFSTITYFRQNVTDLIQIT